MTKEITITQRNEQEMTHLRQLAKIANSSKKYPDMDEFTILNIMLSAKDLGISPFKALNGGFYIVKGKICMSTALMTDRIRSAGHSVKIPEWTSQKCVILAARKDNTDSIKFEYTMEDAKTAGLTGSPTWAKFPKQMLYNRAMSTIARVLFPDVIGNCYSEDEKYDIMDVHPSKRPADDEIDMIQVDSKPNLEVSDVVLFEEEDDNEPQDDISILEDKLERDGVNIMYLNDYLKFIETSKQTTLNSILKCALHPELYPKFKAQYEKEVAKKTTSKEGLVA